MTVIRKQDVISSVADALQYISYYHPLDFVQALEKAYEKEIRILVYFDQWSFDFSIKPNIY